MEEEKDRMSMAPAAVPTVHLNGTGKVELERQLHGAITAIQAAISAVQETEPHGRDYYPQSQDVYQMARDAHERRMAQLRHVQLELDILLRAIWAQSDNRKR